MRAVSLFMSAVPPWRRGDSRGSPRGDRGVIAVETKGQSQEELGGIPRGAVITARERAACPRTRNTHAASADACPHREMYVDVFAVTNGRVAVLSPGCRERAGSWLGRKVLGLVEVEVVVVVVVVVEVAAAGHSRVAGMQLRFPARSTHIKAVPAVSPTI
ncbi:unnamed protein product [Arctogadus glacialis]